jgi:leucyl aminopeptidase
VLADALALASEGEPDAIVDLATLTGAVETALGDRIAGLMGNHDGWVGQVAAAAGEVDEDLWHLPLPDAYRAWLDSDVADLRNIGKVPKAGTLTAGLFLREFVAEGIPWAHLDIAGTSWTTEVRGIDAIGGTGYGVRLLVELARSFRRPR